MVGWLLVLWMRLEVGQTTRSDKIVGHRYIDNKAADKQNGDGAEVHQRPPTSVGIHGSANDERAEWRSKITDVLPSRRLCLHDRQRRGLSQDDAIKRRILRGRKEGTRGGLTIVLHI